MGLWPIGSRRRELLTALVWDFGRFGLVDEAKGLFLVVLQYGSGPVTSVKMRMNCVAFLYGN